MTEEVDENLIANSSRSADKQPLRNTSERRSEPTMNMASRVF